MKMIPFSLLAYIEKERAKEDRKLFVSGLAAGFVLALFAGMIIGGCL